MANSWLSSVDDRLVHYEILDCYACLGTKKCLYYVIKVLFPILPMFGPAKSRVNVGKIILFFT